MVQIDKALNEGLGPAIIDPTMYSSDIIIKDDKVKPLVQVIRDWWLINNYILGKCKSLEEVCQREKVNRGGLQAFRRFPNFPSEMDIRRFE